VPGTDFITLSAVFRSFSDIAAFKDLAIAAREKQQAAQDLTQMRLLEYGSSELFSPSQDVDEDMTLRADLEQINQLIAAGPHWEVIRNDSVMAIERMRCELTHSEEMVRFSTECELTPWQAYDMMTNATPERASWDDAITYEKLRHNQYKMTVKLPMVRPMTYHVKVLARRDFPHTGDISWVYRAVDPATGEHLTTGRTFVGKSCVVSLPGRPNRCILYFIETVRGALACLPDFLLRILLRNSAPRLLVDGPRLYRQQKGIAEVGVYERID